MQSLLKNTEFLGTKHTIDVMFVLQETNKTCNHNGFCCLNPAPNDAIELLYDKVKDDPVFPKPPLTQDARYWKYRVFDSAHCTPKQPKFVCNSAIWQFCRP